MFCYLNILAQVPALSRMEEVLPVLEAAMKYGITELESLVRDALIMKPLIEDNALQIFAIACRYWWGREARAARNTLCQLFWQWYYVTKLETITVITFRWSDVSNLWVSLALMVDSKITVKERPSFSSQRLYQIHNAVVRKVWQEGI